MAFKELTAEELLLLSEDEKEQYENELALYKERVAFVEHIEKIEKSDYEYEKPQLKRIEPVRKLELPKYKNVSKYRIVLDEKLVKRVQSNREIEARQSNNDRIQSELEHKVSISSVPKVDTVAPIHKDVHFGDCEANVKAVQEMKKKPSIPQTQFEEIEKPSISNVNGTSKPEVHNIEFEYKSKKVVVTPMEVQQPAKMKAFSKKAVVIDDVPTVEELIAPHSECEYIYDSENVAKEIEKEIQLAKGSFSQVKISEKVSKVNESLASVCKVEVDVGNSIKVCIIPNVGANKESRYDIKVAVSEQIKGTKVDAPVLKKSEVMHKDINLPTIEGLICPELCPISEVTPEVSGVTKVDVNIPSFNEADIISLKNRILKSV